ncbi:TRUB2 synthase, partial [Atractosteus spatula]|nr:TRUB2 synthase [Atractosteus spatula]MBN3323842.1 TRUB2 synthase [Atractosteus spatula]
MAGAGARLYRGLEGLFAVYKPPGVSWNVVRDTVETSLLKGMNSAPPPAPRLQVRFLPASSALPDGSKELTLTAVRVPVLADHPLVTGPQFRGVKVGVGHRLDVPSSGVLVLGVGRGNRLLTELYNCHLSRDYTLHGQFGRATEDFSPTGRLIERTTYSHITRDKLEKVLAVIQGTHQRALLTYSGVDLQTQEAYDLAVKGLLRPMDKSPPLITGLRCLSYEPPDFTLEVQCLNETQKYLRKLVHEVGLELRSAAVCCGVRRTRDGPFTLQHALPHQRWTLTHVTQAVREADGAVRDMLDREGVTEAERRQRSQERGR